VPRSQVNWRARPATAAADLGNRPVFRTGRWDFATLSPPPDQPAGASDESRA
jgi:hypothetical protein